MRDIQRYDGMLALDNAFDHLPAFADMVKSAKEDPSRAAMHVPNVMLNGLHGTGKTSMIKALCAERGLKLAILTGSTLDVFVHILGIPVVADAPDGDAQRKTIEFIRSHDLGLDDADVVFVDETNRSPRETRNALFEVLLNHSINGVALPNLKWCLAAINPVDLYSDTYELDQAMCDRFPIKLTTAPQVNDAVLKMCGVDAEVAQVFHAWWNGAGGENMFAAGPDMLKRMSSSDPDEAMLMFMSPRTVTEAALIYTHTRSLDMVGLLFGTQEQRDLMGFATLSQLLEQTEVDTVNALGGSVDVTNGICDVMSILDDPSRLQGFTHELENNADNVMLQSEVANGIVRAYMIDSVDTSLLEYLTRLLPAEHQESIEARIGKIEFDEAA